MSLTAVSLASIAADHLNLDDEARTRVHRVVRNFVDKDVTKTTTDPTDGRAPRIFDESEAGIALLLFPLARMAVDVRTLRKIAERLRALDTLAGVPPIRSALAAVADAKSVRLIVTPGGDLVGDEIHACFEIEGGGPEGAAATILDGYKAARGEALARWTIHANPLLSVLVPGA